MRETPHSPIKVITLDPLGHTLELKDLSKDQLGNSQADNWSFLALTMQRVLGTKGCR